ncbi:MAG: hypothetical protein GY795_43425 [Desulfobacterales bacterium]|nr:hypothetical protein [Desulfobacterales bacterium]
MAVIDKFLGKQVEIPEDLRYCTKQGLWARKTDMAVVFGFTHPALVLMGGIKDIDWLADDGAIVKSGDPVIFAVTGKILYIDTPISGVICYNKSIRKNPVLINKEPYGQGWMFMIQLQDNAESSYMSLVLSEVYVESLRTTEGSKNPNGLKGGVSGICKAVYSGIGEQQLK